MSPPVPILLTHYGDDWIRGSERCLLDLLRHLDRDRFRPVVWCNAPALEAEVAALDVKVHRSRFTILIGWDPPRWDVRHYVALVREGRELARRHGARLLHANSGGPNQWLLPVARTLRLPLLTHLHCPYGLRDRCTLALHQTSLAVGVSQGCLDGLIGDGMPISQTRVIHNAVDIARLAEGDARDLRGRLGIGGDDVVLTQVGSLIHRKGVDVLLQALAALRRDGRRCHLLVVGDGPDRGTLERLTAELGLAEVTHFLGVVARPGPILRDATDIAVSPARGEGFGLTVIEAGAFGVPVVATATEGMREIVTDGETGLIVPIEDASSLAKALAILMDDVALRRRLGGNLRREVETRFGIDRYVREFENAYQSLLERPRNELRWSVPGPWARACGRWIGGALRRRLSRRRAPAPEPQQPMRDVLTTKLSR